MKFLSTSFLERGKKNMIGIL